jgi:hypothetical protein
LSTQVLGRNARLLKDVAAIGYGKNISVKASAEIIKAYSMDALTPAVTGAGKQSFTWSMERLYTDDTYIALFLAGTQFDYKLEPQFFVCHSSILLRRNFRKAVFSRVVQGVGFEPTNL